MQRLNRSFDSNVSVFIGEVDTILNIIERQTLGIALVQSKPAKVETNFISTVSLERTCS